MALPAFTGSGASVLEMFSTGAELTVVVTVAPAVGAVSFESIWYEPLVMIVPFASGLLTLTTSCAVEEAPALSAPRLQVTTPPENEPPPVAETNVVFAATASETTTPVALSVPVFDQDSV